MQEGKLIKLLKALSKEEFRRLGDYINSPFFLKKSKDALLLYNALKRQHPDFQSVILSKKRVFKKVYPNQAYSDGKFRNLMTKLVNLIDSYLLYLDNEKNKLEKEKRLISIYGKRNIYDVFVKKISSLTKLINKLPYRDAHFYHTSYFLESELCFHVQTDKNDNTINILKSSLQNFEHYFVLERCKLGIDLKNRVNTHSENHIFSIDKFPNLIPNNNYVYQLYYISFQLLSTEKESIFFDFKDLYFKNVGKLKKAEKNLFFYLLQNFIIRRQRLDPELYQSILFDFLKLGLKEEILFENGKIKAIIFLNIIAIALKNKKFEWAKCFIKKYGSHISESTNGFTLLLSSALIAFHEEKYLEVLQIINTNAYPNQTLNHFGFRLLSIRALFKVFQKDHNYYDDFLHQCASFERYLLRNNPELPFPLRVEMHINFIKIIRKSGKLIFQGKLEEIKKKNLLFSLNSNEKIVNRKWLIDELEAI